MEHLKTHIRIVTKDSFQAVEAVYEIDTSKPVIVMVESIPGKVSVHTDQPKHEAREVNILLSRAEVISITLSNAAPGKV